MALFGLDFKPKPENDQTKFLFLGYPSKWVIGFVIENRCLQANLDGAFKGEEFPGPLSQARQNTATTTRGAKTTTGRRQSSKTVLTV